MKVDISKKYFKEEEARGDPRPYESYYDALSKTFNLNEANGLCDVGCANGWVLHFFKNKFPDKKALGLEYFDWHKEAAEKNVKDSIRICDIRDPLSFDFKYDIVNCTEVGEHIEPEKTQVFLDNLKSVCNKYLIISWSNTGGVRDRGNDKNLQHLNPLNTSTVKELFLSKGFKHENKLEQSMFNHADQSEHFRYWWRNSLSVWTI